MGHHGRPHLGQALLAPPRWWNSCRGVYHCRQTVAFSHRRVGRHRHTLGLQDPCQRLGGLETTGNPAGGNYVRGVLARRQARLACPRRRWRDGVDVQDGRNSSPVQARRHVFRGNVAGRNAPRLRHRGRHGDCVDFRAWRILRSVGSPLPSFGDPECGCSKHLLHRLLAGPAAPDRLEFRLGSREGVGFRNADGARPPPREHIPRGRLEGRRVLGGRRPCRHRPRRSRVCVEPPRWHQA
mmetsp:Transcript_36050/g.108947  ORF Transcript_36050/g.108947 Transcript_36050/m.108947 type:complete len:239 (-) Transcript_36050:209-925(-)